MAFYKVGDFKDANHRSFELWGEIAQRSTIAAGSEHTVAVKGDGTEVVVGYNYANRCKVDEWTDIV